MRANVYEIHPIGAHTAMMKGATTKKKTITPMIPATSPANAPRAVPRATNPAAMPAMRANIHPKNGIHPRRIKSATPAKMPMPMLPGGLACMKGLRSTPQFGQKFVSNHFPQRGQKVKVYSA
jgi:hypothetical protein